MTVPDTIGSPERVSQAWSRTFRNAMTDHPSACQILDAAATLRDAVDEMTFPSAAYVLNPLRYAWECHRAYVRHYAGGGKRAVLVGMNPGPWGMAQTGVPFGEVAAVRDWLEIDAAVGRPERSHPKRPIEGFDCGRSEVSGRRLWGLFQERFGNADAFSVDHYVANYCPLLFLEDGGRNLTPDKLPVSEREPLEAACDLHLARLVEALEPRYLVGIGKFAVDRCRRVVARTPAAGDVEVVQVLHPSPASPAANRGWAQAATRQLVEAGVWAG